MSSPFELPNSFVLRNLCSITSVAFELKTANPHYELANQNISEWFRSFQTYNSTTIENFLNDGRFDIFAGLSFPHTDQDRLETCLAFFLWAFSTDDLSDIGSLRADPLGIQEGHDISYQVLFDCSARRPEYPYAAMLWDILRRIRESGTIGLCARFIQAFLEFSSAQVYQAFNRQQRRILSFDEFAPVRRCAFGVGLVETIVEYSLGLDIAIPAFVFKDPVVISILEALGDIIAWPNDLCSFNKEQADGDYQNMIFVLQQGRQICDLQEVVDILTDMTVKRVAEYQDLNRALPSFGAETDSIVKRFFQAYEDFVQGCIVWYYVSPRYFGANSGLIDKEWSEIVLRKGKD
ncbi:terpene cyclase [Moniliophthora roreri]|uniref:Terpene synthase n=1 Tax=Moniliophthora roreri TaxID=221103 RepID=A0A0W0FC12_MONRR|nr:terpene cyclase [Moniliophthora roreri]